MQRKRRLGRPSAEKTPRSAEMLRGPSYAFQFSVNKRANFGTEGTLDYFCCMKLCSLRLRTKRAWNDRKALVQLTTNTIRRESLQRIIKRLERRLAFMGHSEHLTTRALIV